MFIYHLTKYIQSLKEALGCGMCENQGLLYSCVHCIHKGKAHETS